MKKFIHLTLALVALCFVTACGGPSTPGAAAKRYMEMAGNGQYEKFVDGIAVDEDATPEEVKQFKTMMVAMLEASGKAELEKKQGLKSVEVVNEEIAEDGQTAKVTLKSTYGDGTTDEETNHMVLRDGVWKMELDK